MRSRTVWYCANSPRRRLERPLLTSIKFLSSLDLERAENVLRPRTTQGATPGTRRSLNLTGMGLLESLDWFEEPLSTEDLGDQAVEMEPGYVVLDFRDSRLQIAFYLPCRASQETSSVGDDVMALTTGGCVGSNAFGSTSDADEYDPKRELRSGGLNPCLLCDSPGQTRHGWRRPTAHAAFPSQPNRRSRTRH